MKTWNIYYDGLCQLCSREMDHYQKLEGAQYFNFIDITHPQFNAIEQGLDPIAVNKMLHIKSPLTGEIKTGVNAFIEIWSHFPRYHWAGKVSSWRLFNPLIHIGYALFAKYRRYLPKRKSNCGPSPYCDNSKS